MRGCHGLTYRTDHWRGRKFSFPIGRASSVNELPTTRADAEASRDETQAVTPPGLRDAPCGRSRCWWLGAATSDQAMRTNLPDIFAAGDCVHTHHRLVGITWLGTTAHKQGRVAGA